MHAEPKFGSKAGRDASRDSNKTRKKIPDGSILQAMTPKASTGAEEGLIAADRRRSITARNASNERWYGRDLHQRTSFI